MDACLRAARKQAGHRGPKADIRVYEESGVDSQFPNADHACADGRQVNWEIRAIRVKPIPRSSHPIKSQRGVNSPQNNVWENRQTCLCVARRQVAQQRIYVEHSIRRIKGWRILREDYRLGVGLFPMIAGAVVGLVQLDRILGPACACLCVARRQADGRQVNDKENRIEGRDRLIFLFLRIIYYTGILIIIKGKGWVRGTSGAPSQQGNPIIGLANRRMRYPSITFLRRGPRVGWQGGSTEYPINRTWNP